MYNMPMFKLGSRTGRIGEDTACVFLEKHGFTVIDRNYWRKWGEIDIIAEKEGKMHFVEVKSVTRPDLRGVSLETGVRPEENVHPEKLKKLSRVIQTYLAEKGMGESALWQFDVVAVYLDMQRKQAKVYSHENVIIDVL